MCLSFRRINEKYGNNNDSSIPGSPIIQCSVIDIHAMLLTADGQFVMLTLRSADNEHGVVLHCFNPSLPQVHWNFAKLK